MRTLLKRIFIENWQRKLVALILAMIIWMVVNHSLTVNKTINDVAIRILNIPEGKTVEGLQTDGILNRKIPVSITGNKSMVDQLSSGDIEVVIDAKHKEGEWVTTVGKKNIICKNPDIDLSRAFKKIHETDIILRISKLVKEQIPIVITEPIGEAPRGYQFNDIFPYRLRLSVKGPEEVVKRLKTTGVKLTFNLNEITKDDLDLLSAKKKPSQLEEISYFVPEKWKKVYIPALSEKPLFIDDLHAKNLRIDFLKTDFLPIEKPIPIDIFYPQQYSETINPDTFSLSVNGFVEKSNGIKVITAPLYAKGVSKLFLDIVKDRIELVAVVSPRSERKNLLWNVQFVYPYELENRYVSKVLAQEREEVNQLQPHLREEYLRNRFRNYMNRFRLYLRENEKLALNIELQTNTIEVLPKNSAFTVKNEKSSPSKEQPKP
ncbi:MAG: hypothetical protein PVI40_03310 [Chlamydiota bacterium]|jgi:hypothetical protein